MSGGTPHTVTVASGPTAVSGEWVVTLNVDFATAGEAVVNYYLMLSDEAGECSSSSQHSRLNPAPAEAAGDVTQTGAQNVPVPANQIIEVPENGSIEVTKDLDPDTDGGLFDLLVDTDTVATDASDGDSGTKSDLLPGTYTVSELAGEGDQPGRLRLDRRVLG